MVCTIKNFLNAFPSHNFVKVPKMVNAGGGAVTKTGNRGLPDLGNLMV